MEEHANARKNAGCTRNVKLSPILLSRKSRKKKVTEFQRWSTAFRQGNANHSTLTLSVEWLVSLTCKILLQSCLGAFYCRDKSVVVFAQRANQGRAAHVTLCPAEDVNSTELRHKRMYIYLCIYPSLYTCTNICTCVYTLATKNIQKGPKSLSELNRADSIDGSVSAGACSLTIGFR